jgi:hypothetical protein
MACQFSTLTTHISWHTLTSTHACVAPSLFQAKVFNSLTLHDLSF